MQEIKKSGSNTPNQPNDPTSHVQQATTNLKGSEYEKTSLNPEDLDDRWLRWKCLMCCFVYEGQKPLNVCPKCGNNDPDLFDDAN
jgi:rubrerythrin